LIEMRIDTMSALGFALLVLPVTSSGKPDLRTSHRIGSLTVYSDDVRNDVFYYAPLGLEIARTADGAPDLHLLESRYTGTASGGDRGSFSLRSLLTFRVILRSPRAVELVAVRQAVAASTTVNLRPLPIRRLEAALVYSPIGADAVTNVLAGGHFESSESTPESGGSDTYWSERVYSLALDPESAQLYGAALQRGQVAMSLGYAFFADGVSPEQPSEQFRGSPRLIAELKRQLQGPESDGSSAKSRGNLVLADALEIIADLARWPQLFRQIDINESAPPGYAVLAVYCYDFRDQLRPDLYEKQVEVEAQAVSGQSATLVAVFGNSAPDLYARSLRFAVAVRLDRPYRYRIVEVHRDGQVVTFPWQARESWTELVDVTSLAASRNDPGNDPRPQE
jgi:hypothetical protein